MITLWREASAHVPTYTYTCTACNDVIEKRQSFSDAPLTTCEQCGGTLRKVIHPVGIVFKGSGWYITDSRSSTSAANGPTSPEADRVLYDKGVFLIPDILCNAGGVTVSYFEWVQDLQNLFWREATINARLKEVMVKSFNDVLQMSLKHKVNMRTAAYMVAVGRVAEATLTRGIYP